MSIRLHSTNPADLEAEPTGHNYRLSDDQYRRAVEAGIVPEANGVELHDGFLVQDGSPYRLTLKQYRAMIEAWILTADDRIELLEGWLIAKMSKDRPHIISANRTFYLIMGLIPAGWYAAKEDTVQGTDSEPEPDISIVRGSFDDYQDRTPGPGDVALLIEVADTSLYRDRRMKKRLYARAGFSIYWLINLIDLIDNRVEVYTEPSGPTGEPDYLSRKDFGPNDRIPLVIEGREIGQIAVRELLP
jgi:Uma2 family endonuclease